MTLTAPNKVVMNAPSSSDVVLSVQGVSKKFCRDLKRSLMYGMQDISKEMLGLRGNKNDSLREKEFWALQDVSFELKRGEALGLVGKNGSGKSTLLRVIAGLIKPDLGIVQVKGRVAPLIALGAGFNPILTGRENIYANMSILGLSKAEIDERFDEVVEFAEIGEAIDSPIQSYSSGMAARLGFACAIYTEPDVLLIDEVLAVGDAKFRAKCSRKLGELRLKDTSFILVSHNAASILSVCDSAIYILKGKQIVYGDSIKVVNRYEKDMFSEGADIQNQSNPISNVNESEDFELKVLKLCFKDQNGRELKSPVSGKETYFVVSCRANYRIERVCLGITVRDLARDNETILTLDSAFDSKSMTVEKGTVELEAHFPYLALRQGVYDMRIFVHQTSPNLMLDIVESYRFEVVHQENQAGLASNNLFYQPRTWKVKNEHKI